MVIRITVIKTLTDKTDAVKVKNSFECSSLYLTLFSTSIFKLSVLFFKDFAIMVFPMMLSVTKLSYKFLVLQEVHVGC